MLFAPSPMYVKVRPAGEPKCSATVCRSARIWQGWNSSVSVLITGTPATLASSSMRSWPAVRQVIAATCLVSTRPRSAMVSPRPRCVLVVSISSGWPPSSATPTVNETRVRRLGLSKSSATVLGPCSGRAANRSCFMARARLSTWACSAGVRSSSRRKCLAMLPLRLLLGGPRQDRGQRGDELRRLRLGDDQRRREPDGVRLDRVDQEARRARRGVDGGRLGLVEYGGEPQAAAANPGEQRVIDGRDAAHQGLADRLDVLEQVVSLDGVEYRERRGAGDRVAAEGGPVVAGDERGARLAEPDARADRQPAAEALGEGHHIGGDTLGLMGEPRARPADAGLDLIEHEQRARVVAGLPGGGEVAGRRGDHAALALGRLEEDRGDPAVDGVRQGGGVAV